MTTYRLTQFSPGAGCGCKISPRDLEEILHSEIASIVDPNLLVGNDTKDDAAVYDLGNGQALISTTDFFTPIVDDPYEFGRIASVNAISDIYAMGGKPLMAISILGWPLDKLPKEEAKKVIEGARSVCLEAGITLAGGHSIDISDPVFGLAVSGIVLKDKVKQNNTARSNSLLYLTKPLGIGMITTAEKNGIVKEEHRLLALKLMTSLNKAGVAFAELDYLSSMTDVTGFGLLGHLLEMCEGSGMQAEISFDLVPKIDNLLPYIEAKSIPGGTIRNWKSYGDKVSEISKEQRFILCDPQTSGGLLLAVDQSSKNEFEAFAAGIGLELQSFGQLKAYQSGTIRIQVKE
jgi:selenide, water dikinase